MLFFDTRVAPSEICGIGLYTTEKIAKGSLVADFVTDSRIITEQEYIQEVLSGNRLVQMSGVRWFGDQFVCASEPEQEDYINHSFSPNVIYCCGFCFAGEEILKGTEITLDYRCFLSSHDCDSFLDLKTGFQVQGYRPEKALEVSILKLRKVVSEIRISQNTTLASEGFYLADVGSDERS